MATSAAAPRCPASPTAHIVEAFTEKPDKAVAAGYLSAGTYSWNSGIFVFRARAFLDELARLEPAILEAARQALADAKEDLGFLRLDAASLCQVAQHLHRLCRHGADRAPPPCCRSTSAGATSAPGRRCGRSAPAMRPAMPCAARRSWRTPATATSIPRPALVATIGVKDLVIVDTPDALLVADRARAQDVSTIVARLKQANRKEHAQHLRNYRPWGYFETLSVGPRFQVKLLHVKPGAKLSMQMHHHRSEHWVVVHGTAKVSIGKDEKLVRENESVYIVATQWHRLENPGKTPLELIEVQIGSYLGEDDIVRSRRRLPPRTRRDEVAAARARPVNAWSRRPAGRPPGRLSPGSRIGLRSTPAVACGAGSCSFCWKRR